MRFPNSSLHPAALAAIVASGLGLVGTAGATAAGLITTSDIKNETVHSQDIRDGHVYKRDLSRGLQSQIDRLAQPGPLGLPGAPGKDGANGSAGKDGLHGADGLNGHDGADGLNGKDGLDGVNGLDGAKGADGVNGENGAAGQDGIDGKSGLDGQNGADGKNGVDGQNGADGKNGLDGQNGADGKNATMGAPIPPGSVCAAGGFYVKDGDGTERKLCHGENGKDGTSSGGSTGGELFWQPVQIGAGYAQVQGEAPLSYAIDSHGMVHLRGTVECVQQEVMCEDAVAYVEVGTEYSWHDTAFVLSNQYSSSGNVARVIVGVDGDVRALQSFEQGNVVSLDGIVYPGFHRNVESDPGIPGGG